MQVARVTDVASFQDGTKKVVRVGDVEVGIFRVDGSFYAWRNVCPHQGGPVCQGRLFHRVVEVMDDDRRFIRRDYDESGVHIVCPWHGGEFDVRTGRHAGTPELALTPVDVFVEADEVYIRVPHPA
jgi:nitrite reductase/ring-hydroxylating ferredoxin subunit